MSLFFTHPPLDFSPKVEVSTCALFHDKKTLLLQGSEKGLMPKTWGIPGGKNEPGETPEETIKRELFEELGEHYRSIPLSFIQTTYVRHRLLDYTLHLFKSDLTQVYPVVLNPNEHLAYVWTPLSEFESYNLLEGQKEAFYLTIGENEKVSFAPHTHHAPHE